MRKLYAILIVTLICLFGIFQENVFAAMSNPAFLRLCREGTAQEIEEAIRDGANVNAILTS